jgi:hypothetical protein
LEVFQLPEVMGEKNSKNSLDFFYIWFSVCSQKYQSMIKVLCFTYGFMISQIWLNLLMDDEEKKIFCG